MERPLSFFLLSEVVAAAIFYAVLESNVLNSSGYLFQIVGIDNRIGDRCAQSSDLRDTYLEHCRQAYVAVAVSLQPHLAHSRTTLPLPQGIAHGSNSAILVDSRGCERQSIRAEMF